MPDPRILIAVALRRGAQGLRLVADLLDPPTSWNVVERLAPEVEWSVRRTNGHAFIEHR